jgi:gluconate 2-dehydrogenase gamma chain
MSTHDKARRAFLIKTAAGVGAAAASVLPESQAFADAPARADAPMSMPQTPSSKAAMPKTSAKVGQGEGVGAFFNIDDMQTVTAIAERIMPAGPGMPGAKDLGVSNYIDLALSGSYSRLQEFYRHGLKQLDAYSNGAYKQAFVDLDPPQQDEVLTALQDGKATGFEWPNSKEFFETLRTHTMEGMFADPVYGGNKDYGGWRLVGFPGAQETFTKSDMESSGPFTREPIIGMQS